MDVRDGRVVKGVRFVDIRDAGDPVEAACRYEDEGADELCFLDITASHEGRKATLDVVTAVAEKLTMPLTVGGGVGSVEDFSNLLHAGADKVSVNSGALRRPQLIAELADKFGSQCVVLAVDAQKTGDIWHAYSHGGRKDTGIDVEKWCARATALGAGEILLTSMDADGTMEGYDTMLLERICNAVDVPVIASGGAGKPEDFCGALAAGADAVLAASIFHDGLFSINMVKMAMFQAGIEVRM